MWTEAWALLAPTQTSYSSHLEAASSSAPGLPFGGKSEDLGKVLDCVGLLVSDRGYPFVALGMSGQLGREIQGLN